MKRCFAVILLFVGGCAVSTKPSAVTPAARAAAHPPVECMMAIDDKCMRYKIPLLGNPGMDVALRNKYIAAFGTACYMSEVNTFDCFYKKLDDACTNAQKIAEVYGAAPYEKGHMCQPAGTDQWSLQIGPDVANVIYINYMHAQRQTPLVQIGGTPTAVNGPYRNLPEPATLGPGHDYRCATVDNSGTPVTQWDRIIDVNRKAHNGKVYSDLPNFRIRSVNRVVTAGREEVIS